MSLPAMPPEFKACKPFLQRAAELDKAGGSNTNFTLAAYYCRQHARPRRGRPVETNFGRARPIAPWRRAPRRDPSTRAEAGPLLDAPGAASSPSRRDLNYQERPPNTRRPP